MHQSMQIFGIMPDPQDTLRQTVAQRVHILSQTKLPPQKQPMDNMFHTQLQFQIDLDTHLTVGSPLQVAEQRLQMLTEHLH